MHSLIVFSSTRFGLGVVSQRNCSENKESGTLMILCGMRYHIYNGKPLAYKEPDEQHA